MNSAAYRSANEARRQRNILASQEQQLQQFHKQRHEALLAAVAGRMPVLREEQEQREQAMHTFRRSTVELTQWSQRMAKARARGEFRGEVLGSNVRRAVNLAADELEHQQEDAARRAMAVQEEKCRLMIWRVQQHDKYLIDCVCAQRRLVRAESRIRECYEAEELKLRDEAQTDYDKKPWQPFSQLFGV